MTHFCPYIMRGEKEIFRHLLFIGESIDIKGIKERLKFILVRFRRENKDF